MVNAFREFFLGKDDVKEKEEVETQVNEVSVERNEPEVEGKIIKVSSEGWGFIITPDIPFTRIFFHWTSLVQDTLKFPELRRGMRVKFVASDKGQRGFHAIKIRVMENPEQTQ